MFKRHGSLKVAIVWYLFAVRISCLVELSMKPRGLVLCFIVLFVFQPIIREGAVAALRAALTVTSQREGKASQTSQWYKVSPHLSCVCDILQRLILQLLFRLIFMQTDSEYSP